MTSHSSLQWRDRAGFTPDFPFKLIAPLRQQSSTMKHLYLLGWTLVLADYRPLFREFGQHFYARFRHQDIVFDADTAETR